MCGIAGFHTKSTLKNDQLRQQALRMSDAIAHRGPDGDGAWCDQDTGIALSQRRLAIVDLTDTGAQPMTSSCGKLVIVYNGEIYNADDLKTELSPFNIPFKGTSDTEVILEGFAHWGIEKTLKKLIGMFAIAVWNRETRKLTLARDRMGIKPLYWSKSDKSFLFGSELKAMREHPDCPDTLDHQAIANYLNKSYINSPRSIFSGIHKLPPGCILTYSANAEPSITSYWSLHDVALTGAANTDTRSDKELIDELESLLKDAVKRRMVADVPLGAFLSGGVDSSTVVALMQAQSDTPIKSFSIGFEEDNYNEAPHAQEDARHLGTDHCELYINSQDALDVIPQLHTMYDEPFADISQIPTYLISKLTREHVTVALSGDGGDELFTGYERYFNTTKYHKLLKQPKLLRDTQATILESLSQPMRERVSHALPDKFGKVLRGKSLQKVPALLRDGSTVSLYRSMFMQLENTASSLSRETQFVDPVWENARQQQFKDDRYSQMQYIDCQDYLPDDILVKVDRASMATSLEARVPILDHRVVEFSWRLPQQMKVRDNQGKWILKEVLDRHVPKALIDRPKMGFGVPIDSWLRGPLQDWAENLLSEDALRDTGIFNPVTIRERWKQHQDGVWNWQYHLWSVLMMQTWLMNTSYRH